VEEVRLAQIAGRLLFEVGATDAQTAMEKLRKIHVLDGTVIMPLVG